MVIANDKGTLAAVVRRVQDSSWSARAWNGSMWKVVMGALAGGEMVMGVDGRRVVVI